MRWHILEPSNIPEPSNILKPSSTPAHIFNGYRIADDSHSVREGQRDRETERQRDRETHKQFDDIVDYYFLNVRHESFLYLGMSESIDTVLISQEVNQSPGREARPWSQVSIRRERDVRRERD